MRRLVHTMESPAGNLALDEALLDWAEEEGSDWEFLRLWESPQPIVVLGRSSRLEQEVDAASCTSRGIPILRRSSGGAAIVAGPGCLMYAVVLSHELRPELRGIPETHRYVLGRIADALKIHVPTVQHAGTSDLAFVEDGSVTESTSSPSSVSLPELGPAAKSIRKFSGNSLRVKRTHCLYHGTLLYDFDLSLVTACLAMPVRQPTYRSSRGHAEFVTNLPMNREGLENSMFAAWPTNGEVEDWPRNRVDQLVATRYGRNDWNLAGGRAASD